MFKELYKKIALYEKEISLSLRNSTASFFTPPKISYKIVKGILDLYSKNFILEKQLLDPCCGGGIFIVSLFEYLENERLFSKQELLQVASNLTIIELNKTHYTFIKEIILNLGISDQVNMINGSFYNFKSKVDIIFGNPPFGLKHKDIKNYLFPDDKDMSNDSYALFIQHGINILNDTGSISFITPISYMNNKTFFPLRKNILSYIKSIHILKKYFIHLCELKQLVIKLLLMMKSLENLV